MSKEEEEGSMEDQDSERDQIAEDLSKQLEEEKVEKPFKYLQIAIEKENDIEYFIKVRHQSHGFLNYFTNKLLNISGVAFAAYKITSLDDSTIYIRIDKTRDIKDILKEGVKMMRIEWKGMANAVSAMKI